MKKNFWDEGSAKIIKQSDDNIRPGLGLINSIDQIEPLYGPEEAAKILKIELSTLYKFRCQGIIEPTYQGRNLFFTAQQIADCRKRRQQQCQKKRR